MEYHKTVLRAGVRTAVVVRWGAKGLPKCMPGKSLAPEDVWCIEYYGPLEKRIKELRPEYADNPEALAVINREQREIDICKKYCQWYGSAFFVM